MITPDDERQVQPLGRYWNEVAAGGPARPADLDPPLAETVRRLQAIGAAPTPDPAFVAALWEDLMHQAHAAPLPHPRLIPAPTGSPSGPASAANRRSSPIRLLAPGHWWPRLEFVAVALLAVALAGGLAAMNGGLPDRFGAFVGQDDDAEEEGPFPLLQGVAEVPPAGQPPIEVVLRRVTIESGATWETPSGFMAITLESGTLIQSTGVPEGNKHRMRVGEGFSTDGEAAVFANDRPEPAVLFQVMVGSAVRNPDLPSGVTADELGGGTADTLPAGPALVTVERFSLPPKGGETIDTGREGLALVVVEGGTLALGGRAGRVELARTSDNGSGAVTAVADPRRLPSTVPLAAGESALLQGGAFLHFGNESDERVRALVLTVNPGAAQAQIITEESESIAGAVYGTPPPVAMEGSASGPAATPSADAEVVAPEECDVAPRSASSLDALLATGPASTPSADEGSSFRYEDELPEGTPLDAATLAAITEVEREFAACINAGAWPSSLALFTDDTVRDLLGDEENADLFPSASPEPLLPDERIGLFPLRGARTLPDGRVAAIVDWGQVGFENDPRQVTESNFHIYERVDGRWLIAEEISTGL